jgi:hypothetical protein
VNLTSYSTFLSKILIVSNYATQPVTKVAWIRKLTCFWNSIATCLVTIDWVWIGNWMYWPLTDRNYSAIANSHTLQFTTTHIKSFQSAVSSPAVAWWRIPTISSASVLTFLPTCDCSTTVDSHLSSTQFYWLNSARSVEWHSLGTDPTENTVPLLMWVAWYHVLHCSGTVHVMPDRVTTPFPAALLLLRDVTA